MYRVGLVLFAAACTGGGETATDAQVVDVAIDAPADAPTLTMSPASIDFGYTQLPNGLPQPTFPAFQLTAGADLDHLQWHLEPTDQILGFDFDLANTTCTSVLAAGTTCALPVRFYSQTPGAVSGSLVITRDGATLASAALTGLGGVAPPDIAISPEPGLHGDDLGDVPMGSSKSLVLSISNISAMTLPPVVEVLQSPDAPTPFVVSADTCQGAVLAPGEACTTTITFTPTVFGQTNATISWATHWTKGEVQLYATGIAESQLAFQQFHIDLGDVDGAGKSQVMTLTNHGTVAAQNLTVVACSSTLTSTTCTDTLAPGASCAATVYVSPTVTGPTHAGINATSTTAYQAECDFDLVGVNASELVLDSYSVQLDGAPLGDTTHHAFTVTNVGAATSAVTAAIDAPWQIASNGCASVAAGATCIVEVSLLATTENALYTGHLMLTANGATTPAKIVAVGVIGQNKIDRIDQIQLGNVTIGTTVTHEIP